MNKNENKIMDLSGLLTVEAALVLPIFIYAIIAVLYFLQILFLQEMLQQGITETGYFAAKYAYVYDYINNYESNNKNPSEDNTNENHSVTNPLELEGINESDYENHELQSIENNLEVLITKGIDSTFYKMKLKDYVDEEFINKSCIKGGYSGIHTYLSSYMADGNEIDIILVYQIKLPLLFIEVDRIPIVQRVRLRGWTGRKVALESEETASETEHDEEMVFITESGTVYHLSRECSHLTLSIQEVNYYNIHELRNEAGGKYKECEICDDYEIELENNKVYITDHGDRYHRSLSCSGLKRTVKEVPKSQVEDRSPCKRCGN